MSHQRDLKQRAVLRVEQKQLKARNQKKLLIECELCEEGLMHDYRVANDHRLVSTNVPLYISRKLQPKVENRPPPLGWA